MECSKLVNYSTNMCQSGQGTTLLAIKKPQVKFCFPGNTL
jgi:hypothetical protein